jgi:hypothetical protein
MDKALLHLQLVLMGSKLQLQRGPCKLWDGLPAHQPANVRNVRVIATMMRIALPAWSASNGTPKCNLCLVVSAEVMATGPKWITVPVP